MYCTIFCKFECTIILYNKHNEVLICCCNNKQKSGWEPTDISCHGLVFICIKDQCLHIHIHHKRVLQTSVIIKITWKTDLFK